MGIKLSIAIILLYATPAVHGTNMPNEIKPIQHFTGKFNNDLKNHVGLYMRQLTNGTVQTITVEYKVHFEYMQCCPQMLLTFSEEDFDFLNLNSSCFHSSKYWEGRANFYQGRIYLTKEEDRSGCHLNSNSDEYVCEGQRVINNFVQMPLFLVFGHTCDEKDEARKLSLRYSLAVQVSNKPNCENLTFSNPCRKFFTHTLVPNLFLLQNLNDMEIMFQLMYSATAKWDCFTNKEDTMCRVMFIECDSDQFFVPCRQGCQEIRSSCSQELAANSMWLYCENLPNTINPDVCFYNKVVCSTPDAPKHGSVIYNNNNTDAMSTVNYTCEGTHDLIGVTQNRCMYNGKYEFKPPICQLKLYLKVLSIVIPSLLGVILIILLMIYMHRYLRIVFCYLIARCMYYKDKREYDLFIGFHSNDTCFLDKILPKLDHEGFKIYNPYKEVNPGNFRSNIIDKAIQNSSQATFFISTSFLEDEWMIYSFHQAHNYVVQQKMRCLIVVLLEQKEKILNNPKCMPTLRAIIRMKKHLTWGCRLFWPEFLSLIFKRPGNPVQ